MAAGLNYTILEETPAMHARPSVHDFIQQEVRNPAKQWVDGVLDGTREREEVILRKDEFVLLPDTERIHRYWRVGTRPRSGRSPPAPVRTLNWLSILQDRSIRTLRDLRGEHVPMLRAMLQDCLQAIEAETGIGREGVMVYIHYPPSVYQLHVHFTYPYGQFCHKEAFRIHPLQQVIANLEIDPEYYAKVTLCIPVSRPSPHWTALQGDARPCRKEELIQTRAVPSEA
jgi:m7GpppX diphosphatase